MNVKNYKNIQWKDCNQQHYIQKILEHFKIKHIILDNVPYKNNHAFPFNSAFIYDTIYFENEIYLFELLHEVSHLLFWNEDERKQLFPKSLTNNYSYKFSFDSPEEFVFPVSCIISKNIKQINMFIEAYLTSYPYPQWIKNEIKGCNYYDVFNCLMTNKNEYYERILSFEKEFNTMNCELQ